MSNIEISFGGLGPTIGIAGTLRGVPNRQFVSSMTIEIIREHDNLTHRFDWAALRPPAAFVPPDMKEIRAAHGFSLPADEGTPVNILFIDAQTRALVLDHLLKLRASWLDYLKQQNLVPAQMESSALIEAYSAFSNGSVTSVPSQIWGDLAQLFYWAEGTYSVRLFIRTDDPIKTFTENFAFSISRQEAADLKQGIIPAMMGACDQQNVPTKFISPVLTIGAHK